ncbi:cytochrome d ubiquinol oxidase subunit II [Natrialbaceae archaeon AArc-T1-2]|uniref:cytochrome d ubiquinol oxidase subunit II n=1 Tax=Natrialbaceae archaeon AArc-T1-2 TaxID=3053904 RepID=UPI00255A73A2|nr:cytochrome d ubiquinol oxidase subunit II [Natrialbaceae archaeon AArc-T1-2]WIV65675.1 cytochrome d ubiquinol oxidase subunit II [Natrialbaceae archaeon AArc-T1-2]
MSPVTASLVGRTVSFGPVVPVDEYLVPTLPELWFGVLLFTLAMYVFLDGFDFGIGMLYATREDEEERELLLAAFGPVWDANEVWLVAFGTILLAAFPPVYAALLSEHYLLIFAIVFALILRGVTPELREQRDDPEWERACDRGFVAGSTLSPLFIGTLAGSWVFGTGTLSLPGVLTGVATVFLSLAAGAAYLGMKTTGELREEMAAYGLYASGGYLVTVVALLTVVFVTDPLGVRETLLTVPVAAVVVATVLLLVGGAAAATRDAVTVWFSATGGVAVALVVLVAIFLYPTVYPSTGTTVREAVISPLALNVLTVVVIPALVLVLLYFRYLYTVFSGPVESEGYGTSD